MSVKLPKAKQGMADYTGAFTAPVFTMMANPGPLYKNLFNALGKYGARVDNLKIEGQNTSSVSVGFDCLVPNNFVVRIRLDSLQVTFHNLETIGVDKAKQLVLDCWSVIQQIDSSISVATHTIATSFQFGLSPEDYKHLLQAYTKLPEGVPSETSAAVAYYLPRGSREGDEGGTIVLDHLLSGDLNLKISMIVDGTKISASALGDYVEAYVNSSLSILGLET